MEVQAGACEGCPPRAVLSFSFASLECASHWALLCVPLKPEGAEPLPYTFQTLESPPSGASVCLCPISVPATRTVLRAGESLHTHSQVLVTFSLRTMIGSADPSPNQCPQKLWALEGEVSGD